MLPAPPLHADAERLIRYASCFFPLTLLMSFAASCQLMSAMPLMLSFCFQHMLAAAAADGCLLPARADRAAATPCC